MYMGAASIPFNILMAASQLVKAFFLTKGQFQEFLAIPGFLEIKPRFLK